MVFVVEDLKALSAVHSGETGYDVDLPDGAYVTVSDGYVATLDKVLVCLWFVEAADEGPYGVDWGIYLLDHGGAGLVLAHGVSMVASDVVWDLGAARQWRSPLQGGGGNLLDLSIPCRSGSGSCVGGGGVDPVK
ncbi:Hypothetical predicted protein [Olea europaea subsp. europaea]|uniref:Uncharacterized protein n=1 Tax=Olea europaea subsp. europaea TaxID=158383 RepID=A0A8S0TZA1_OLEEU|nr:Hypothetical predicted protein [Olea europaea subsp. europaea]